ncbi:hypothetical protein D3C80_1862880 [compost metagenome]
MLLRWQTILAEDSLEAQVTGFPEPAQWWEIISNAATHNAYHIGQIVYIRKLQKKHLETLQAGRLWLRHDNLDVTGKQAEPDRQRRSLFTVNIGPHRV